MTLTKSEAETGIIPNIYKYLGCVVDEHLELVEGDGGGESCCGGRALSAWLNRCKAEVNW